MSHAYPYLNIKGTETFPANEIAFVCWRCGNLDEGAVQHTNYRREA